jgi:ketosteroid isomerase-like protein
MTRPISPLRFFPLLLAAACAQSDSTIVAEDQTQALVKARQELAAAMLARDEEALDRIYSDDYLLTNRRGLTRTKEERIGLITSGELRYLELGQESGMTMVFYGNVAVVRGRISSAEYMRDGETRQTGPRRFTAIWVYEEGRWQQVARQHTAVVAEGDAVGP